LSGRDVRRARARAELEQRHRLQGRLQAEAAARRGLSRPRFTGRCAKILSILANLPRHTRQRWRWHRHDWMASRTYQARIKAGLRAVRCPAPLCPPVSCRLSAAVRVSCADREAKAFGHDARHRTHTCYVSRLREHLSSSGSRAVAAVVGGRERTRFCSMCCRRCAAHAHACSPAGGNAARSGPPCRRRATGGSLSRI
jgi:hypothetical protein